MDGMQKIKGNLESQFNHIYYVFIKIIHVLMAALAPRASKSHKYT